MLFGMLYIYIYMLNNMLYIQFVSYVSNYIVQLCMALYAGI